MLMMLPFSSSETMLDKYESLKCKFCSNLFAFSKSHQRSQAACSLIGPKDVLARMEIPFRQSENIYIYQSIKLNINLRGVYQI